MRGALEGLPAGARPLALYGGLNLVLLLVEVGYGLRAGSLGLVSDGVHLGINCFGVVLALLALRAGREPLSVEACYGHDRVHVLAAFTNAVFMCFISVFLVVEGLHQFLGVAHGHGRGAAAEDGDEAGEHHVHHFQIQDLSEDPDHIEAAGHGYLHHHAHEDHVVTVAAAGLVINLVGLALLAWSTRAGGAGGHRHLARAPSMFSGTTGAFRRFGSSAASVSAPARSGDDDAARSARMLNLQSVVLHALCDVLNSVGVICSALLVRRSGWSAADPLAAVIIGGIIVRSCAPLLISSGRMLLQVAPYGPRMALDKSIREISAMSGVLECHKEHLWEYAPHIPVITLHVRARDGADEGSLLLHINSLLSPFSHHVTVQITKDNL